LRLFNEVQTLIKAKGEGRNPYDLIRGSRILVVNRGIAAVRAISSIKALGAKAIVIANDGDIKRNAMHIRLADEVISIGSHPSNYNELELIGNAILQNEIDAVYPGWGFLSENSALPRFCNEHQVIFIGPSVESMAFLGDKVASKQKAVELGVPTAEYTGIVNMAEGKRWAEGKYPVIIKGVDCGGGKGIRKVFKAEEFEQMFSEASSEAKLTSGNEAVFLERLIVNPRHIEIQVIGDSYGNFYAFPERDCSLQRRNQKLVEISPSPWEGMTPEIRKKMQNSAINLVKESGYSCAGTVEFLLDKDGNFYFMEVNARLQVEHGISEMTAEFCKGIEKTELDLVKQMILVSFGGILELNDETVKIKEDYFAIECRINAEDPRSGFQPDFGQVLYHGYRESNGANVRLLTAMASGDPLSANFDSAIALLMVGGKTWEGALSKMRRILSQYEIFGIQTTIPFHRMLLSHEMIKKREFDLSFVGSHVDELSRYGKVQHPHAWRLGHFIAKTSALGFNPELQMGKYRTPDSNRIALPSIFIPPFNEKERIYPDLEEVGAFAYIEIIRTLREEGTVSVLNAWRDVFQSDFGNKQTGWIDMLMAPLFDQCNFVGIERFGGAHFHMSLIAMNQMPFKMAKNWLILAPKTPGTTLVRSISGNGYGPLPANVLKETALLNHSSIHWIKDFDFNTPENLRTTAELYLKAKNRIYEPCLSLTPPSTGQGFDVAHFIEKVHVIVDMVAEILQTEKEIAYKSIVLGLKDMAGTFSPAEIAELVKAIHAEFPGIVDRYHTHSSTARGVEMIAAAAEAGCCIVDVGDDALTRFYGQPPVLSVVAALKEKGLTTPLNLEAVRACQTVLMQVAPFWDKYCGTPVKGFSHDVTQSLLAGGAVPSFYKSVGDDGLLHILPQIIQYIVEYVKIIKYHNVTPGQQITVTTAVSNIKAAHERGKNEEVQAVLEIMKQVNAGGELPSLDDLKKVFAIVPPPLKQWLLGEFGMVPLGFPDEWVYKVCFGDKWQEAIASRKTTLSLTKSVDMSQKKDELTALINRKPEWEELITWLNHPKDAADTINFIDTFGNINLLPSDIYFQGMQIGSVFDFEDEDGEHSIRILEILEIIDGQRKVIYLVDGIEFHSTVRVVPTKLPFTKGDPSNPCHIVVTAGNLFRLNVKVGDVVEVGDEILRTTAMKTEFPFLATIRGRVKKILRTVTFDQDTTMSLVKNGELIVELEPVD